MISNIKCSVIGDVREKRYFTIVYLIGIQIVTYIFGMIIGVLGNGISPSRDGYGRLMISNIKCCFFSKIESIVSKIIKTEYPPDN